MNETQRKEGKEKLDNRVREFLKNEDISALDALHMSSSVVQHFLQVIGDLNQLPKVLKGIDEKMMSLINFSYSLGQVYIKAGTDISKDIINEN